MKPLFNQWNERIGKIFSPKVSPATGRSLSGIVSNLIHFHNLLAAKQGCMLINAVPEHTRLYTDQEKLLLMLEKMLTLVLQYGRDTQVIIQASSFQSILMITIKSTKTFNSYAIHAQFGRIKMLANSLGGSVEMNSVRNGETSVSLQLLNKNNNAGL